MTRNYLLQKIQKKETGKRLTQEALLKNQNKRLKRVLQKNNVQKLFECLNKLFMEKEKNENPGHDSHDFQNKSKIIDFEKSKSDDDIQQGRSFATNHSTENGRNPITNNEEFIESDPNHYNYNDQKPNNGSNPQNFGEDREEEEEDFEEDFEEEIDDNDDFNETDEDDFDEEDEDINLEEEMEKDYKKENDILRF